MKKKNRVLIALFTVFFAVAMFTVSINKSGSNLHVDLFSFAKMAFANGEDGNDGSCASNCTAKKESTCNYTHNGETQSCGNYRK